MISTIIPTYAENRVEMVNDLYDLIKRDAGTEVEVIVACDNPAIYDKLKSDVLVKIPNRVGFNRAVNIAEKFASNELVWWLDDTVLPRKNWAKYGEEEFWKHFPNGMGLLCFSGYQGDLDICCSRGLTSKRFAYKQNHWNLIWPEYIHGGDIEFTQKAKMMENAFVISQKAQVAETKCNDHSYEMTLKVSKFDDQIYEERKAKGFPMSYIPDWYDRFHRWAEHVYLETGDHSYIELSWNLQNEKH